MNSVLPSTASSSASEEVQIVSYVSPLSELHLEHDDQDVPGVTLSVALVSAARLNKTLCGVIYSGGEDAHESTGEGLASTGERDLSCRKLDHNLPTEVSRLGWAILSVPFSRIAELCTSCSCEGDRLLLEQNLRGSASLMDEHRERREVNSSELDGRFCNWCTRRSLARGAPANEAVKEGTWSPCMDTGTAGKTGGRDMHSTCCRLLKWLVEACEMRIGAAILSALQPALSKTGYVGMCGEPELCTTQWVVLIETTATKLRSTQTRMHLRKEAYAPKCSERVASPNKLAEGSVASVARESRKVCVRAYLGVGR